jgi:hypothetical protein
VGTGERWSAEDGAEKDAGEGRQEGRVEQKSQDCCDIKEAASEGASACGRRKEGTQGGAFAQAGQGKGASIKAYHPRDGERSWPVSLMVKPIT